MDALVLLARLALAGVFIVSSIGKLLDLEGSERATRNFGVPEPFAKSAGIALPLFELLVAILLLPVATATFGGVLALLLLIAFVVGVGYNMSRGNQFDCHCFGQIHSEPIGWKTLARNGILAAVALLVTVGGLSGHPGPSLVAWTQEMSGLGWVVLAVMLVNLAALAGVIWLVVHLLGQNGRLLVRLDRIEEALADADIEIPDDDEDEDEDDEDEEDEGLPFGTPAPAFSLTGVHGETMTLDALRAQNKPVMLVFSDPNCGPCNSLMPDIGKWQRESAARLTVAVVSRGDRTANKQKAEEHGLTNVLLQNDSEVSDLYQTYGTPTAILVRPDGTIGSGAALGADQIRTLYKQTIDNKVPVPAPAAPKPAPAPAARPAPGAANIGKPAPEVSLSDLEGKTVALADFKGHPTAVLFWNPGCGFCQRMVDDLKAWEANPPAGAPKLLVVSTGDAERNKAQGLASPVVLDEGFTVGRAFGASGTPSAVLVGADGNIASAVGVGAPAVLGILRNDAPAPVAANGADDDDDDEADVPAIGTKAPAVKLPDLDGKTIDLSAHNGTRTLLLFWNPGCGFCQRLLPELKEWEASPPKGAPKLVLVSTGTADANRQQGLRSPILLDQNFSTGSAFGADGTPSAIMVDAKGNVASGLAVGGPEVMKLARSTRDPKPA